MSFWEFRARIEGLNRANSPPTASAPTDDEFDEAVRRFAGENGDE